VAKILVIEDEANLRFSIRQTLARAGHQVSEAGTLSDARALAASTTFDVVLTDVMLGPENGLDYLKELRAEGFEGVIVVMTAHGSVEAAVGAMRDGADDYLQKPLSMEELKLQVARWLEQRRVVSRLKLYERMERHRESEQELLGASEPWKNTLALAARLAGVPLESPTDDAGGGLPVVLLLGETGVGKGALSRFIHASAVAGSEVKKGDVPPFVHVNCSALPASLVEGELFGHERGAFTDAKEARPGLFELAEGGTIFLDEISEMPIELQAKLLVVVEQGTFRRVGGTRERRVRARVIAASNQDLLKRVEEGKFRRDLYYRLNAFTIQIPALRERRGDAEIIAEALLERFGRRYGRTGLALGGSARQAIAAHQWPGNVRELVNAMQRAAMLAPGATIEATDLGLAPSEPAPMARAHGPAPVVSNGSVLAPTNGTHRAAMPGDLHFNFEGGMHLADEVEKELLVQALRYTQGNVSRAAKLIGMQRSSFRYRIERYKLDGHVKELTRS
jgi:two-component system response regulator AtoC